MAAKDIEAFIRRARKAGSHESDSAELRRLMNAMTTEELQLFWMRFSADRAFSSTLSTPDWKTKEQETRLHEGMMSWVFHPKEKDANGRFIVRKEDLVKHVASRLLTYIHENA